MMGPLNNICGFKSCIINFWEWNRTQVGPIKEECGFKQGILNSGECNKTMMGLLRLNVELSKE